MSEKWSCEVGHDPDIHGTFELIELGAYTVIFAPDGRCDEDSVVISVVVGSLANVKLDSHDGCIGEKSDG